MVSVWMCCLWLSVPSVVLVVGVGWCATVPAVRVWDVLPVVSTLDTLPACEGVGCAACGGQFPRCCLWMVSLWDVLPVPVGLVAVVSTLDTLPACEPVPWSVPSTHCQR